jgi:hypothetical protein
MQEETMRESNKKQEEDPGVPGSRCGHARIVKISKDDH